MGTFVNQACNVVNRGSLEIVEIVEIFDFVEMVEIFEIVEIVEILKLLKLLKFWNFEILTFNFFFSFSNNTNFFIRTKQYTQNH